MTHQIQTGKLPAIFLVFCLLTASTGRGDQEPGAGLRTIDLPDGSVAEIAAPAAAGNQTPYVNPFLMLSGALLTDSFDGPQLDATLWSRPSWLVDNHKTIGVKIENGHLVISGPSHPAGGSHQYAGVISKYFRETDVVLAAEVQAQSPIKGEGRIQHMVHLCSGDYPDFFTEIIFGKIADVEAPRWYTAYLAKVWEYSGYREYLQPTRPATGSEETKWHTVVLTHGGTTSKTQNYLVMNEQWIPIGPSHTIPVEQAKIPRKAVSGLYPGDVWALDLRHKQLKNEEK